MQSIHKVAVGLACNLFNPISSQGDIFDLHVQTIENALELLPLAHRYVNVLCWHQGESDADAFGGTSEYYCTCLKQVIKQYLSKDFFTSKTAFIVGETLGYNPIMDIGQWDSRNIELNKLNKDGTCYTRCILSSDLEVSDAEYHSGDFIHFSSNGQRKLGTQYFKEYREIFNLI